MNKNNFNKNLKFENDHLTEEILLMLVDGELSAKESSNAREHLETCWTCRRELEKVEETISLFVEFRKKIQNPLSPAPPTNWSGFNANLTKIKKEETKRQQSWFSFSNLSPFQLRFGIASITTILIIAIFLQFVTVEKVSANQLLDKASASQANKINSTSQPVIYQKLRVRSANSKHLDWEVWNDANNLRSKQIIGGNEPKESIDVLQELSAILQKNKMSSQKPLSPESFKSWHNSLVEKTDEIIENETVTLKTINQNITFDGQISEATVNFRKTDFHPFSQTLKVQTANGEKTFEIAEVDFEVVSLNTLKPNFFDETPTSTEIVKVTKTESSPTPSPSESPTVSPSPSVETSPEVSPNPTVETKTPKVGKSPKAFATAELEVEVLQLLNNAKADLGEEITVKRENGILYVRGLVETTERKTEILNALQSVRQNPAIKIELNTVAEAVAKQKNPSANKPTSVENLETNNLTTAAENDLVQHFGSEAAARSFATRTVNGSGKAMSHVFAMRRLSRQFSPAELQKLSPEAKAKLVNLITSHARNFKNSSENLSRDLAAVFNEPKVSGSINVEVNSLDDLPRAIESLFSLASTNDRLIRSALTISANDTKISALRATQFWQSLKNAELLASKIAALK